MRVDYGTAMYTGASVMSLPVKVSPVARDTIALGDCFSNDATLSVEESRLDRELPGFGKFGPTLVEKAGFAQQVNEFSQSLCGVDSLDKAKETVRNAGKSLYQYAIQRAQDGTKTGEINQHDDRPLYWTRLILTKAIKRWRSGFALPPGDRKELVSIFIRASRGLDMIQEFFNQPDSQPDSTQRVVLAGGFDPFKLDGDIRTSNPAGAIALQLSGKSIDTPDGSVLTHAAILPVLWRDDAFDEGLVEAIFGPALRNPERRAKATVTISQSLSEDTFSIERWASAWRYTYKDNNNVSSPGLIPPAEG